MPELLITRVQDVKVLETTAKELHVECERAQQPRFQVRLTLLPKRRTTWTLNLATKVQARLDEITTKRDGTKKDVSDRDTRMNRGGLCQRS